MSTDYDFWVCDNCRQHQPKEEPQVEVRVQERTERIWGTEETFRPIERLVICRRCYDKAKAMT